MTPSLPPPSASRHDDAAYIAPMAAFLLLTFLGGGGDFLFLHWPKFPVASYILKTFLTAALLIHFRKHYLPFSFRAWHIGILLGILGIIQWCGVEELLGGAQPKYPQIPGGGDPMNPFAYFAAPWQAWSFIIIRWAGAVLVVPFMEELFWRDYLWRTILAPNNFRLATIGEWHWQPALITLVLFVSVHPQWITALIWGILITALLVWKKSLGACIAMHAVTNFLLGVYTLYTGKWYYW
jgi:uncharacterized protein